MLRLRPSGGRTPKYFRAVLSLMTTVFGCARAVRALPFQERDAQDLEYFVIDEPGPLLEKALLALRHQHMLGVFKGRDHPGHVLGLAELFPDGNGQGARVEAAVNSPISVMRRLAMR